MRILVTGSSGQIGTNLALRLLRDGHEVFGVDKRPNPWVGNEFPTLLQDLAGHYPAFPGGINGVEYPDVDLVVHLAAHAKVHQLVRQPHRALENAIMTFNVLEYARGRNLPIVFSSTREVYGDVHRFEEYAEEASPTSRSPRVRTRRRRSPSEAFIYSYARCYGARLPRLPLLERLRAVRQRPVADGTRAAAVDPPAVAQRADHDLRRRQEGSTSRTSTTASTGSRAGSTRSPRAASRNETINLAYGQGNTLVRAAELIAQELGVEPQITIAPSLLGEVTHYVADVTQGARVARLRPADAARRGHPKRSVAWFQRVARRRIRRRRSRPCEVPTVRRARSRMASRSRPAPAPEHVLALFGPTASGKTAVAGILRERLGAEVISADSAALYAGLPVLTAAPDYPARLVGVVPLEDDVSVGEYQRLAHDGDRREPTHRSSSAGPGSTSARRCRASSCRRRRRRRERAFWQAEYDRLGPEARACARSPSATRRLPRASTRTTASASSARSSSRKPGTRSRPAATGCGPRTRGCRRRSSRSTCRSTSSTAGSRSGRARWPTPGAADEARAAWARPLSATARKVLGLEQFATLPEDEAVAAVTHATRRLARYQRKWLRRMPRRGYARREPGRRRRSPMRSSRWDAQGNIYLVTEESLTPERRACAGRRHRRHPRGLPLRRRLGRDRDLEPRRLAGGDVRQRHAHRGALAGRADRRVRGRRSRRRRERCARACSTGRSSSRTWARSSSPSPRRWTASASSRWTSATRTRSSKATRPTCRASARCSRCTSASRAARTCRSRGASADGAIEARVWERGAGETRSSGSSAVAVAAAFGAADATIRFPGGELHVRFDGGRAFLTGPAVRIPESDSAAPNQIPA